MSEAHGDPNMLVLTRPSSSVSMLAERVRQVGRAYQARDEPALREELRALSREAGLLATVDPLLPRACVPITDSDQHSEPMRDPPRGVG